MALDDLLSLDVSDSIRDLLDGIKEWGKSHIDTLTMILVIYGTGVAVASRLRGRNGP